MPSNKTLIEQLIDDLEKLRLENKLQIQELLKLQSEMTEYKSNLNNYIRDQTQIKLEKLLTNEIQEDQQKVIEADNKIIKRKEKKRKNIKRKKLDVNLHFGKNLVGENYEPPQTEEVIKNMGLFSHSNEHKLQRYDVIISEPVSKILTF